MILTSLSFQNLICRALVCSPNAANKTLQVTQTTDNRVSSSFVKICDKTLCFWKSNQSDAFVVCSRKFVLWLGSNRRLNRLLLLSEFTLEALAFQSCLSRFSLDHMRVHHSSKRLWLWCHCCLLLMKATQTKDVWSWYEKPKKHKIAMYYSLQYILQYIQYLTPTEDLANLPEQCVELWSIRGVRR